MKRILLTGMSGTGKSAVIEQLASLGYRAVDLDCDAFSEWAACDEDESIPGTPVEPDRDWVRREDRVGELLSAQDGDLLLASGCASNMGKFLPGFDRVILLSAPAEVIAARLAARTNNSYGKRAEEVERVLDLIQSVEPLLRKAATDEIDTSAGLDEVVGRVLRIAQV